MYGENSFSIIKNNPVVKHYYVVIYREALVAMTVTTVLYYIS